MAIPLRVYIVWFSVPHEKQVPRSSGDAYPSDGFAFYLKITPPAIIELVWVAIILGNFHL
jgi:hypothetical protein